MDSTHSWLSGRDQRPLGLYITGMRALPVVTCSCFCGSQHVCVQLLFDWSLHLWCGSVLIIDKMWSVSVCVCLCVREYQVLLHI